MKPFKKIARRLLYPGIVIKALLIPSAAGLLIYVFLQGETNPFLAGLSYGLSAYALVVLILWLPPFILRIRHGLHQNSHTALYLGDHRFRAEVSLYAGLVANCLYGIFKLLTGIIYQSAWFGAMAFYYVILSLCRFMLLKSVKSQKRTGMEQNARIRELHSYHLCGIFMLILNMAATAIVLLMIWQNKGYTYPEIVIYAVALYAFYSFILALINVIKFRKMEQPVLSAVKMLSLARALMSMLALQTAMLAQFGGAAPFRWLMNCLTGIGVCLIVFAMAIYMIVQAGRERKKLSAVPMTATQMQQPG